MMGLEPGSRGWCMVFPWYPSGLHCRASSFREFAVRKAAIEIRRFLHGRRSTRWGRMKHLCGYASDDPDEYQSRRRVV